MFILVIVLAWIDLNLCYWLSLAQSSSTTWGNTLSLCGNTVHLMTQTGYSSSGTPMRDRLLTKSQSKIDPTPIHNDENELHWSDRGPGYQRLHFSNTTGFLHCDGCLTLQLERCSTVLILSVLVVCQHRFCNALRLTIYCALVLYDCVFDMDHESVINYFLYSCSGRYAKWQDALQKYRNLRSY